MASWPETRSDAELWTGGRGAGRSQDRHYSLTSRGTQHMKILAGVSSVAAREVHSTRFTARSTEAPRKRQHSSKKDGAVVVGEVPQVKH